MEVEPSTQDPYTAAETGQEALYGFMLAWQDAVNLMAAPRSDVAAAADQLQNVKEKYIKHFAELEAAAATVDSANVDASQAGVLDASPELLARERELNAKVAERQKQIKCIIDKLRTLQHEICVLTTATTPLETFQTKS